MKFYNYRWEAKEHEIMASAANITGLTFQGVRTSEGVSYKILFESYSMLIYVNYITIGGYILVN